MKKLLLIGHVKILEEVKAEYSKYRVGTGNKGRESQCGFNTQRGYGQTREKSNPCIYSFTLKIFIRNLTSCKELNLALRTS